MAEVLNVDEAMLLGRIDELFASGGLVRRVDVNDWDTRLRHVVSYSGIWYLLYKTKSSNKKDMKRQAVENS